jgi:hypothetical protein
MESGRLAMSEQHEWEKVERVRWNREEKAYKAHEREVAWLRMIFEVTWPEYCRACGANGVIVYYESHGLPGPGEQIQDGCETCDDRCPRCAKVFSVEESTKFFEDSTACPACGWKWGENPGDTCPEF